MNTINHNSSRTADAMEKVADNTKLLSDNLIKIDTKIEFLNKHFFKIVGALLLIIAGVLGVK